MTTTDRQTVRCGVCGEESAHAILTSTNTSGSSDLDTRPPPMLRDTISLWVQRCPSCGYCAPELAEAETGTDDIVSSPTYQEQLTDETYPQLARSFLCTSLLSEASSRFAPAGWSCLRAAWACDDEEARDAARSCRNRAVALFRRARADGQQAMESRAEEHVLVADILRRAGHFEEAQAEARVGLDEESTDFLARLLRYERERALARDAGRRTVADVDEAGPPD